MRHSEPASCVMTACEKLDVRMFDVLKSACVRAQVGSVIKVISA